MIRASYSEMKSAANDITKSSEDYQANVEGLYTIVDNLTTVWKGTDNISYADTVNSYKKDMQNLGEVIKDYATFLTRSADAINEAQEDVQTAAGRL